MPVEMIPYNDKRFQKSLEAGFYLLHTYSKAPEASAKRMIDVQIMGNDFSKGTMIDLHSEAYLKELIKRASNGKFAVIGGSSGIDFFIVKGGGEGFLPRWLRNHNADRVISTDKKSTSGEVGYRSIFDYNDLIAAFDKTGTLISSALLERPVSISVPSDPSLWRELTATTVYDAWDGQRVSLYQNTYFFLKYEGVKYYGLRVDDSKGYYRNNWARIDIHKQENTNGCMFIVDPNTPPLTTKRMLDEFEPQFIKDIRKAIGAKAKENIGKMHMITIK
jgi:hypothetical protein